MAMFGTAVRRFAGTVIAAVTFFGATIAAHAVTYQIEDVNTGSVVGTFEAGTDGSVLDIAVSIGGVSYDALASGSDGLVFDSATGALNASGSGFTALTNGSGGFFRIINTVVNGQLMLEWDLLTGASFESADLVSFGHYTVTSASSGTVSSVPVPASAILLGTVLVGAGAVAARRRKRAA